MIAKVIAPTPAGNTGGFSPMRSFERFVRKNGLRLGDVSLRTSTAARIIQAMPGFDQAVIAPRTFFTRHGKSSELVGEVNVFSGPIGNDALVSIKLREFGKPTITVQTFTDTSDQSRSGAVELASKIGDALQRSAHYLHHVPISEKRWGYPLNETRVGGNQKPVQNEVTNELQTVH